MKTAIQPLAIRGRLLRRMVYRAWKSFAVWKAGKLISRIRYESNDESAMPLPAIILSSYEKVEDFLVLMHVFREHDLMLVASNDLPKNKIISQLKRSHQILEIKKNGIDFSFLRQLIVALKIFNRSVVVSPEAGRQLIKEFTFNPGVFSRIAIKANAPIQPVIINWSGKFKKKCEVLVGKRIFISPRHPEFKDVFFRRRDPRKFSNLSREEFGEIGERIMKKFYSLKREYGSNLS